jgi:hypothetical protein
LMQINIKLLKIRSKEYRDNPFLRLIYTVIKTVAPTKNYCIARIKMNVNQPNIDVAALL